MSVSVSSKQTQGTKLSESDSKVLDAGVNDFDKPQTRAAWHYHRAKRIFTRGNRSRVEMEMVIQELNQACSFVTQPNFFLLLARVYMTSLDMSNCINTLRLALVHNKDHRSLQTKLMEALVMVGKEQMLEAQQVSKKEAPTILSIAIGNFEEAQSIELIIKDVMDPKIFLTKAVAYVHLQDYGLALVAMERAMKIHYHITKGNAPIDMYILKAKILHAQGLMSAGNKEMAVANTLDPDHPEVKGFMARTYSRAERMYQESVEHFSNKLYDEALTTATSALAIVHEDVKVHVLLAKIYRAQGDFTLSISVERV